MDVNLKYDTVSEAVAAVRAAHPTAHRLEATTKCWEGEVYFDPGQQVVIVIDDYSYDDADPENVRLRQFDGFNWGGSDWAENLALVEEYVFHLGKLEEAEDEVDDNPTRQLINETLAVMRTCRSAEHPPRGTDELERGDHEADWINAYLAMRIDRFKDQMSLLASMRAQNILNRLEARGHRHGAKREVAEALGMKPQNIQDVLAAYYRRLNMLG